jgi:hypothetical protein
MTMHDTAELRDLIEAYRRVVEARDEALPGIDGGLADAAMDLWMELWESPVDSTTRSLRDAVVAIHGRDPRGPFARPAAVLIDGWLLIATDPDDDPKSRGLTVARPEDVAAVD